MKQFVMMALVAVMMTSCMSVNIGNSAKDDTPTQVPEANKVTAMQPFDEVSIAGGFNVFYEQGDSHSVRIEAPETAINEMTVYVKGDELRIRQSVKKNTFSFSKVKIFVTSPDIKSIELAGSGMFAAKNRINVSGDLDAEVAGSGSILLVDVACKEVEMSIAGSGNIEIGRITPQNASAKIAGSGNIILEEMTCAEFDIEIAGSGDVNCANITADDVHTEIAGSGDVNLTGMVKNHTKSVAGSGKVNIVEPKAE